MRITSFVMAVIGTVFGIIFGLVAMAVGGTASALGAEDGNTVVWLGVSAIAACVFGMLCSGFHFGRTRQGWMTAGLFIAAGWHLVSISAFAIPGFLFFLLAAIFALFGREPSRGGTASGFSTTPFSGMSQSSATSSSADAWVAPPGFRPYVPPEIEMATPRPELPPVREERNRRRTVAIAVGGFVGVVAIAALATVLLVDPSEEPAEASSPTVRPPTPRPTGNAPDGTSAGAASPSAGEGSSNGASAAVATPPAAETATQPAPTVPRAGPQASRTSPVPLGSSFAVGDWVIRVDGITPNATQQVLARNQFNDPPASGRQFFMVAISALYNGEKEPSQLIVGETFKVVGASNVAYDYRDDCGVVPSEMETTKDVYRGGTISGNLCWSVASSDVDTLVLHVEQAFSLRQASGWFALR